MNAYVDIGASEILTLKGALLVYIAHGDILENAAVEEAPNLGGASFLYAAPLAANSKHRVASTAMRRMTPPVAFDIKRPPPAINDIIRTT